MRRFVVPSCGKDDPGELVFFRMEGRGHFQHFRDARGMTHHNVSWHVRSATTWGLTSGATYRVSGGYTGIERVSDDGQVRHFETRFHQVHPETGNVFIYESWLRFVMNANGELVFEDSGTGEGECR